MSETTLPATVTFDELHALRIKGRASDEALGHMLGVSPYDAAIRRAALVSEGLAQYREGRMPGSSLTPDGRELHSALLTERLTDAVKRSAVEQGLANFLPINGATHFTTLSPVTHLIAKKILLDDGVDMNITFTEDELAGLFTK